MKNIFVTGMILAAPMIQAETITSRIHAVENGIVKFENGRVAFLDSSNVSLKADDFIEAHIDSRSSLKSYKTISAPPSISNKSVDFIPEESVPPVFEPTVVQGMQEAWKIFKRSNPNYKRISECSDRAHVWAHDEFKKSGTKSEKAFVFFTASYINSVRFKWWFHVAPMYTVNDSGTIKKLVMDYRYTARPMTVKEWTDQFVYTKRDCKVTTKFSDYEVNPQVENCFLIFESMHYKLPGDIYLQETDNQYKTTTTESELKAAYRYAFQ